MIKAFSVYKKDLFVIFCAFIGLLIFIPFYTYVIFAKDLGSRDAIMNRNNTGLVLTDRNDVPFASFYEAKRKEFVPLSSLPRYVTQSIISIEDKDYYNHPGFSITAILRSVFTDLKQKELAYGGSTITQQLVKNALLTPQKSFVRKLQELVLAQEIERRYNKQQILEMYVNSVYFGEGSFGVESAAENYFGKKASELDLSESALLAAILTAPSQYSPISGDKAAAFARQKAVLTKMVEQGYITSAEKTTAEQKNLTFAQKEDSYNTHAIHFALYVKNLLEKKYGEEVISRSGYKVKTSIDLSSQEYAEQVVKTQVERLAANDVSNGAAVVLDPQTSEILVMVGSKDWNDDKFGKVNMAIAPRQPGSSFKPIVYLAAIENQYITPATILKDVPTTFKNNTDPNCTENCDYKPLDYDRRFRGNVTVRRALANSLNIPAVEVMQKVGIPDALSMAKKLGITTLKDPSQYGLSLVLGSGEVPLLEMTNAYATFASLGIRNDPTAVLEITNKYNENIYTYTPVKENAVSPAGTFLISSILSDNNARAEEFGSALTISRPAAVKTGTTEDYRDALTLGYTPDIVVGVWVGNNDNTPMDQIAGSLGAAPIWRQLMEKFNAGKPIKKFTPPPGVVSCSNFSVPDASLSAKLEFFLRGTEPRGRCIDTEGLFTQPTDKPSATPTPNQSESPTPTSMVSPTPTVSPTPDQQNNNNEGNENGGKKEENQIQVTLPVLQ